MESILDTNIWIYLLEGRREVLQLKTKIEERQIVPILTHVTFTEVLGWNELKKKEEKRIRDYFSSLLILPLQTEHWEQVITWRKLGRGKRLPDLLIAANSKFSNFPILTRNVQDFNRLEVSIENPWVDYEQ